LDLNDIKELLGILQQQEISEFELEHEGVKLRIRKASPAEGRGLALQAVGSPAGVAKAVSSPGTSGEAGGERAGSSADDGLVVIKSPMVGTFYRSPNPESPAFVSIGDRIRVGQVLCIIEAMKLMNEIEAEQAGEIVGVQVENGQAVQYGDPLFTIRPA